MSSCVAPSAFWRPLVWQQEPQVVPSRPLARFSWVHKVSGTSIRQRAGEQRRKARMVQLQLVAQYEDEKYEIEYDTEDGRDVLGWQLFSLTGVDPKEQRISGLFKEGSGDALCDGVKDGQVFILSKNTGDTAGRETNAGRDTSGPPVSQLASLAVKSDEELARQLQEEEDAQLARTLMHIEQRAGPARHLPPNVDAFRARLESGIQTVMQYEDPARQEKARALIPLDKLEEKAAVALLKTGESGLEAMRDALLVELLHWFKATFKWVNAPSCDSCGAATEVEGMVAPTSDDLRFGAGRVEGYRCRACGAQTRFPRYNDPGKLLDTQRGRCGEWANAFTLCCRALGYEARWVLDWTDHVWTEVWSEKCQRWLHADACEDRLDVPLLYEAGWGKKLSYVISFWKWGVVDTTQRYTAQLGAVRQRRTEVGEEDVARLTAECTARLRAGLGPQERAALESRDGREREEMRGEHSPSLGPAPLPGRQTGSLEWRAARGELGSSEASPSGAPPPETEGETPAGDEHVGALWAALSSMWVAALREAGQRGVATGDMLWSRLTLVQQVVRSLKGLPWRARRLEIAEGKPVKGRQLSAKGEAAYRKAIADGAGGRLLEAVGFQVEEGDGTLRLLPALSAAHIARSLPVALDFLDATLAQLKGNSAVNPAGGERLSGGYVSASGENGPYQRATAAFDGVTASKWLVHGGHQGTAWLQYRALRPAVLACYWLTSGEDCPERDPASWTLEATSDGGTWHVLDQRSGIRFDKRNERRCFTVPGNSQAAAFTTFRFRFTSVRDAGAGCLQLSSLDLVAAPGPMDRTKEGALAATLQPR